MFSTLCQDYMVNLFKLSAILLLQKSYKYKTLNEMTNVTEKAIETVK